MAGNENSGRKPKQLSELPGDWKRQIMILGKEGKTLVHVYDTMGISENAFKRLADREPELKEVIDLFKNKTKIFWMDVGQDLSTGKGAYKEGNANAWRFNMQNRVGWTDKVVTETETTIKVEETAADLFKTLVDASKKESDENKE